MSLRRHLRPAARWMRPFGSAEDHCSAAVAAVVCKQAAGDPPHFLLINRPVDDQGPATLRHPFGLPLVRLNRGEAAIVAAARAVEEECGLSAESLRWHPVPITAATSHRHSEKCSFLIAYCFAWYIATGEGHFPNPFEDSFRWSSSKKLREVTRKESLGLSFAREVLAPLELTEQLLQKDVLQRSQPEEW
eukprot:s5063_g6.t1